ncbi:MAG: hypothetical protein LUC98_08630 [Lachnospiraceae bacterium]|nr:hypothetical protein [Lachnospiraceae bacterium]
MLEEILKGGREQATPTRDLMRILRLDSERELRLLIAHERAEGVPICSTTTPPGGYFLPENAAEARHFVASMDSRLQEITKATAAVRKYLETMEEGEEDG